MNIGNLFSDLEGMVNEIGSREYFREGTVVEVDLTGDASGNFNRIAPAVKVDVAGQGKGEIDRVPFWLRLPAAKQDKGGNIYFPPDEGSRVLIGCPGGVLHQGIILCCLSKPPTSAGTTADERNKHAVIEFGDLRVIMNRNEGEEEYTITIPGSDTGEHLITLRRKIDSRGIVIQTAGGHYLVFQDLETDKKIELKHSSGTRITISSDGSWEVVIEGDQTEHVAGDRDMTVLGNDTQSIGKNQNIAVTGTLKYTVGQGIDISGLSVIVKSNTTISLQTIMGALSGILTQLTHQFCYYNGAPIGCSMSLFGSP